MESIKKHWPFLLGLVLSLSLLWPLFWAPSFIHHDDIQPIRLFEMYKCFIDFQIPCRWVPDLGGLYGYPLFNYYAPLPYYFGGIIYFFSHSLLFSFKLMLAVSFIGAYIFMYLLASKFWGKLGGSLSAIFYSFAPYHALDFYVRGAMGEMWGLMFFPAVFWATVMLEEKMSIKNILLLGVFLAGLILSHNISAMIFLPFFLVWIFLLYLKNKSRHFLILCFSSVALGILLASFYLLPVIIEKEFVHVDSTVSGYFAYTEHFKGFKKLFLERSWDYGGSVREVPGGEKDRLSYQIGWVHILGWLFAMFSSLILWKKDRYISLIIIFSSIAASISIFMVNPRSDFIWKLIDPLKFLQFPWRLLLLIIFFISFISGSFSLVFKNYKKFLWSILIILVFILNFSYFKPKDFIQISDEDLLHGSVWEYQIKRAIFDFLPIYAKEPPPNLATSRYEILTGDATIANFREGTNWIKFNADIKTHTIIRLSQYYFPDWKIWVDGKEISFEYKNNNFGLMTFIIGKGNHTVEARLMNTNIRIIGNWLTLLGLVISSILLLIQIKSLKKWILYYRKGLR